ncbi:MAG: tripartite tricarboxylate transporter substrate binding protein [Amaricoccus sp.]
MTLSALPLAGAGSAWAQETFPSKPITIIVPASGGTSIDTTARFVADLLGARLGESVIVENRPGSGGLLGYLAAARAPADGYTLILTGIPLYLLPLFHDSTPPPFDPVTDFAAVARVARVPFAIVVAADAPYQTIADLIDAMKAAPGQLTYSSQGVGSSAHLCSVILNDMTGAEALHVGYKETTTAMTDVAAGRVTFTCQTSTGVLPWVQGGRMRALAVTGTDRWKSLPDVPTAQEAGIAGFEVSSQLDFMAPAGTPPDVIATLSQYLVEIAQTPEFGQFCDDQLLTREVLDAAALGPQISQEAARWADVARLTRAG